MKRFYHSMSILLILALLLAAAGCGGQAPAAETAPVEAPAAAATDAPAEEAEAAVPEETAQAPAEATAVPEVPASELAALYEQIAAAVTLPAMVDVPAALVLDYYGIDAAACAELLCKTATDGLVADEIVLVKTADQAQADAVEELLNAHLDARKTEMKDYLPEQYDVLKKAVLRNEGGYVFLAVSPEAETIDGLFGAFLAN